MDYYIRRPSLHSPVYESRGQPRWIVEVDPEEEGIRVNAMALINYNSKGLCKTVAILVI